MAQSQFQRECKLPGAGWAYWNHAVGKFSNLTYCCVLLFRAVTDLLGPNADLYRARGMLNQVLSMLMFRPQDPNPDRFLFDNAVQGLRHFARSNGQQVTVDRLERLISNGTRESVAQYENEIWAMLRERYLVLAPAAMQPQEIGPLQHANNDDVRSDLSSGASGGSSGSSSRGTNATAASGSSASSILAGGERAAGARNLLELGQAIAQEDNGADVVPPREEP